MALGKKPIEILNEGNHPLLVKAAYWDRINLGEIADVQNGYAFSSTQFSKNEGTPLVRIRDIDNGKTVDRFKGDYLSEYIIRKGDILVGMDGDFKAARWNGPDALLNQRVCRIIPKSNNYNDKFLFLCLQPFLNAINSETSSITVKHLSSRTLQEIPLPRPPLSEQLEIVTMIEVLFSELDKGKQQLETVKQQLKTYRQAVLKSAFEGRFTNRNIIDGQLPEGWEWQTFQNVCNKIGDIDHKMPKSVPTGFPYVSTKDFTDDLKISFEKVKYIDKDDYLTLSRKIKPEKEDIIFPRYGTIGKNIFVDFEKEFLVSYSCAVIKPNKEIIIPKYIYYYSLSPQIEDEIRSYIVETTQANIGIASIKRFIFPLPPLSEQKLIVQEIETRLSVCDKMEETIENSLRQVESLRQSILKQAFEGKLL
jgi:type I restriction enzyme S subunit